MALSYSVAGLEYRAKTKRAPVRLTKEERDAGIGLKCLIIARKDNGEIARVLSPLAITYWEYDGATWTMKAQVEPTPENTAGVYVTYKTTEARKYRGALCKVILSGTVIEHETGARGQFARLLEVCK